MTKNSKDRTDIYYPLRVSNAMRIVHEIYDTQERSVACRQIMQVEEAIPRYHKFWTVDTSTWSDLQIQLFMLLR